MGRLDFAQSITQKNSRRVSSRELRNFVTQDGRVRSLQLPRTQNDLGGCFGFLFFCSGAGERTEVCEQVAGWFVLKMEGGGSHPRKEWGGGTGVGEGVCAHGEGGGGKIFFSGAAIPTE